MSVGNESWVDRLGLKEGESFEHLDTGDQVDVICDAFEQQWRDGTTQPIECFLEGAPVTGETLSLLHQQLIPLEMEFRSDAGETISFRDYFERIPAQALFIARVLGKGELDVELDPPLTRIGSYWLLESG